MHYSYRSIDSYNTPIRLALSKRGLGKTFGAKIKACSCFVDTGKRFVYVVENLEMIKTLAQDSGAKFFNDMVDYLDVECPRRLESLKTALNGATNPEMTEDEEILEINGTKLQHVIKGGTIKIDGKTAGYAIAISDFANLKRNAFTNMRYIIIDEFIPENVDVRSLRMPYKLVSLVQSVARTQDVIIYMLANTIRLSDPILVRLGLSDMKVGELRVIKDKYGPLVAAEYVDNDRYKEFAKIADASVAGRFAAIMGETDLDENIFKDELSGVLAIPTALQPNRFFCCLHGEAGSVRIHAVKNGSEYYVFDDYGRNVSGRYCVQKKYIAPDVRCEPVYGAMFLQLYQQKRVKFDNALTLSIFKNILGIA